MSFTDISKQLFDTPIFELCNQAPVATSALSCTTASDTHYKIYSTFGKITGSSNTTNAVITDNRKKWSINQWAGKRVSISAGFDSGQEIYITSNTATALTCLGTFLDAPDSDDLYTILGCPIRNTGSKLIRVSSSMLFLPRGGGSNTVDIYNPFTNRWTYGQFLSPQQETLTTGSMYAYDGVDTIYININATGRVLAYSVSRNRIVGSMQLTMPHGTAVAGNRMEVITTEEGLKYLYIMQHSGTIMWRALISNGS